MNDKEYLEKVKLTKEDYIKAVISAMRESETRQIK